MTLSRFRLPAAAGAWILLLFAISSSEPRVAGTQSAELKQLCAEYEEAMTAARELHEDASHGFPASMASPSAVQELRSATMHLFSKQVALSNIRPEGDAWLHAKENERYLAAHMMFQWTAVLGSWTEETAASLESWDVFKGVDRIQTSFIEDAVARSRARRGVAQLTLNELERHAPDAVGYDFARKILELIEDPWRRARALLYCSGVSLRRGAYDLGIEEMEQASLIARGISNGAELNDVERLRAQLEARLWIDLGVSSRSIEVLSASEELLDELDGDQREAYATHALLLSDAMLSDRRQALAVGYAKQARAELGAAPSDDLELNRLRGLADLALGAALAESEREGRTVEDAEEPLRSALDNRSLKLVDQRRVGIELANYLLRRDRIDEALEIVDGILAAIPPGDDQSAYAVALRASCYRAALRSTPDSDEREGWLSKVREQVRPQQESLDAMLERWKRSPANHPGGIGFLSLGPRREVLSSLVETLLLTDPENGAARAVTAVQRAQQLGSLARAFGADQDSVDISETQKLLMPETQGLLVLLPARNVTHAFTIDSESVRHERLAPRHELLLLAAEYARTVEAGVATQDELGALFAAGQPLSKALLPQSVRDRLSSWSDLTMFGSEYIGVLPLESLPLPGTERLLGEAVALTRGPSLPVWVQIERLRPASRPEQRIAAVADLRGTASSQALSSGGGSSASPLEELEDELQSWCGELFTDDSLLFEEGGWTKSTLLERSHELADFPVTLFLLHGESRQGEARTGSFRIAGGREYLTCSELERHFRFTGLVAFASCGAGIGPERLGEDDPGNMGGAALRAGAHCTLLSRADLPYLFARKYFQEVFRALDQGASYAEAARRAREITGKDNPAWRVLAARVQAFGNGG